MENNDENRTGGLGLLACGLRVGEMPACNCTDRNDMPKGIK